ncbi:hypothetical protein L484_022834 [Morus notabilis]|uniref:Uncharacterized protein n=1 Tax=Morus notabilis TaxID=981085 RepID=W9S5A4_9ROSA|nr:hypothetical protein L484_022834 [Morus notabilis]
MAAQVDGALGERERRSKTTTVRTGGTERARGGARERKKRERGVFFRSFSQSRSDGRSNLETSA